MSNFGLSKPWIASYNAETGVYTDAFKCGKAINTSVTPNNNEGQLFADNKQTENVKEFKNANVALVVDTLPAKAPEVMFGHHVEEDGTEISNADDTGHYVGYGFITTEINSGIKKYRACLLHKVQFVEGEESYQTRGDAIVFSNPNISGTAIADNTGNWRTKSPYFDTEKEADDWIQKKLGVITSTTSGEPGNKNTKDGE